MKKAKFSYHFNVVSWSDRFHDFVGITGNMAPSRKSKSLHKRFTNEASPDINVGSSSKTKQRVSLVVVIDHNFFGIITLLCLI